MSCGADQCNIDSLCVADGEAHRVDACLKCDVSLSTTEWTFTQGCGESSSGLSTAQLAVVIALSVLLFICIVAVIVCCFYNRSKKKNADDESRMMSRVDKHSSPPSKLRSVSQTNEYFNGGLFPAREADQNRLWSANIHVDNTSSLTTPSLHRAAQQSFTNTGATHPYRTNVESSTGPTTIQLGDTRPDPNLFMPPRPGIRSDMPASGAGFGLDGSYVPGFSSAPGPSGPGDIVSATINVHDNATIKVPLGEDTFPIEIARQKQRDKARSTSLESLSRAITFEEVGEVEARAVVGQYGEMTSSEHTEYRIVASLSQ